MKIDEYFALKTQISQKWRGIIASLIVIFLLGWLLKEFGKDYPMGLFRIILVLFSIGTIRDILVLLYKDIKLEKSFEQGKTYEEVAQALNLIPKREEQAK